MKKLLIIFFILSIAVISYSTPTKQASEYIGFWLNEPIDSAFGIERPPDSAHVFTIWDNATAMAFSTRAVLIANFGGIGIDTIKHYGDTLYFFSDQIQDIDGSAQLGVLDITVNMWYDDIKTTTMYSVQVISDSLENMLDASKDSSSSAAVLSKNNLDSLQEQDDWVAKEASLFDPTTDSVIVDVSAANTSGGLVEIQTEDNWDELLTGATHNINNSSGKILRQIKGGSIIHDGQSDNTPANTANQFSLETSGGSPTTSTIDNFYNHQRLTIVEGTGEGQVVIISDYNGTNQTATITPAFLTTPDATSIYEIIPGLVHAETQGGGYAGGAIWVSPNGVAGTQLYVNGTIDNPIDDGSFADAKTVADALNMSIFRIQTGSDITLATTYNNYSFDGTEWTLALGGQDLSFSTFRGASVTGIATGSNIIEFFDCKFGAVELPATDFLNCGFGNNLVITDSLLATGTGQYIFRNCYSLVSGTLTPVFSMGDAIGNTKFGFRGYDGGMELSEIGSAGNDSISIEGFGNLVLNATDIGGELVIRGNWTIDSSAGGSAVTLTRDAALSGAYIADVTWDEDSTGHYTSPKMGFLASQTGSSGGISDADMASIVDTFFLRALADTSDGSILDKVMTYLVRNVGAGAGGSLDSATVSNMMWRIIFGIPVGSGDDSTTIAQRLATTWGPNVNATLNQLYIDNQTTNDTGVVIRGNGTAPGLFSSGGINGDGAEFVGGATSGRGFYTHAIASNSHGYQSIGFGTGNGGQFTSGSGATGNGVGFTSLSTNGNGILLIATGVGEEITTADMSLAFWNRSFGTGWTAGSMGDSLNNTSFMGSWGTGIVATLKQLTVDNSTDYAVKFNSGSGDGLQLGGGGASGNGIRAIGGAGGGSGFVIQGTDGGVGFKITGGATGVGMEIIGGSTSGAGARIWANGTNDTGLVVLGIGSGHGISATGGATGVGIKATGGSTSGQGIYALGGTVGDGFLAQGRGGQHGFSAIGQGSGDDIRLNGNGYIASATDTVQMRGDSLINQGAAGSDSSPSGWDAADTLIFKGLVDDTLKKAHQDSDWGATGAGGSVGNAITHYIVDTVKGSGGTPDTLAGATVTIRTMTGSLHAGALTTNSNGYVSYNAPSDSFLVIVEKFTYVITLDTIVVSGTDTFSTTGYQNNIIVSDPSNASLCVVNGQAFDLQQNPIQYGTVTIKPSDKAFNSCDSTISLLGEYYTETNSSGYFEIAVIKSSCIGGVDYTITVKGNLSNGTEVETAEHTFEIPADSTTYRVVW